MVHMCVCVSGPAPRSIVGVLLLLLPLLLLLDGAAKEVY
jgi:hypothetical protein